MHMMDYQDSAIQYAAYPKDANILYPLLALSEEVGEFTGKIAKALRKGDITADDLKKGVLPLGLLHDLESEAGDILWQFSAVLYALGISLEDVARWNLDKLADRKARNVIIGEGDNR